MKMENEGRGGANPTTIQNTGVHSQDSFQKPVERREAVLRPTLPGLPWDISGGVFWGSEPARSGLTAPPWATLSVRSYHDTFRIFN